MLMTSHQHQRGQLRKRMYDYVQYAYSTYICIYVHNYVCVCIVCIGMHASMYIHVMYLYVRMYVIMNDKTDCIRTYVGMELMMCTCMYIIFILHIIIYVRTYHLYNNYVWDKNIPLPL